MFRGILSAILAIPSNLKAWQGPAAERGAHAARHAASAPGNANRVFAGLEGRQG